jgi:hypothetical protein
LQLFQIAMTNNWQDIMYANVLSPYDVSNLHRVAMAAFFVSFFFCMVSACGASTPKPKLKQPNEVLIESAIYCLS